MKNGVFANYKIFAANSHPELAEEIEQKIMAKISGSDFVPSSNDTAEE